MKKIGIIGLGVMGRNLAYNLMDHQVSVVGYNRTEKNTLQIKGENHELFFATFSMEEFMNKLESPRKILMMIKAGEAVDQVIQQMKPYLKEGDLLIDGGNSFFKDTLRREKELATIGITYYGLGISGGKKGARYGASLMPSGDEKRYQEIKDIFELIAARYKDEVCCRYIGPSGSGHYVKMVHNGIEYADMQLIAEAYLLLRRIGKFNNQQISEIFNSWNQGQAESYLLKISVEILKTKDKTIELFLIDLLKDRVAHKETGQWASIEAMRQEVNGSILYSAYNARVASNDIRRPRFMKEFTEPKSRDIDPIVFAQEVYKGYYLGKVLAHCQGFDMMLDASKRYQWNLKLEDIAAIFRAGCIIQSKFLHEIKETYQNEGEEKSLIEHSNILEKVKMNLQSLRVVVSQGILRGVALPTMMTSLSFIDQLRSSSLGANLLQAQRDYFGAHQVERIDREGRIHYDWESES